MLQVGFKMLFQETEFLIKAEFHSSFPALTGILALALFIHNCLISIVRTQKNPENNVSFISIHYENNIVF